jgi:hypothetical protein
MMNYSWFSWLALFYSVGPARAYVTSIDNILICAMQNDVQDSYYGNKTFIENTWYPAKKYFNEELFYTYDFYWLVIGLDLITAYSWEIIQIPININFMIDFNGKTAGWIDGLRRRDCYSMFGYKIMARFENGCLPL